MSGQWLPPEPAPHKCALPGDAEILMRSDGSRWQCGGCGAIYTLGTETERGDTWRTWKLTTPARPPDPGRVSRGL